MAEVLKSRLGFLRPKPKPTSNPSVNDESGASESAAGGVERRRSVALHPHEAHGVEGAAIKPPAVAGESPTIEETSAGATSAAFPDASRIETSDAPTDETSDECTDAASGRAARGVHGLAGFNLTDLAGQAKAALEAAREESRRILQQAQKDAIAIRGDAKSEGFEEGRREADVDFESRVQKAATAQSAASVATMKKSVATMQTTFGQWMAQYHEQLSSTILAATEKIVCRKLQDEPEMVLRWTQEALAATRSATTLCIAVHPDTLIDLGDQFEQLLQWSELPEQTEVRPDTSVAIGEVSIRQTGGEIQAGLQAQLDRLAELLQTPAST